jgi:Family of unknown function (DUF6221)
MAELRRADLDELCEFVLARLAEDEQRFADGVLPHLDDAERHGRLRIMESDDGAGLLMSADPVPAREERVPVPFPVRATFIRREVRDKRDEAMLGLVASAYDAHPDWRERWRPDRG